jgi:putative thioredoxin
MATATTHVIDVNERDFATAVVQRSANVPVVVDFWAPWCGPCRALGPVLERLAAEQNGAFVLAKVNVDQNQRLSAQFGVQGIPAVKAFRDGKVVDEFTGALPESQVRAWLKKIVPSEIDRLLREAAQLEQADPATAAQRYQQILGSNPTHGPSLLGLSRVLVLQGDPQATDVLHRISRGMPEYPTAEALLSLVAFLQAAEGSIDDARQQLGRDPNAANARWQVAAHLAQAHQWADALQHLLVIVQRDRAFGDDAARRAMLAIFSVLGEADPTTVHYRRQLASALFG